MYLRSCLFVSANIYVNFFYVIYNYQKIGHWSNNKPLQAVFIKTEKPDIVCLSINQSDYTCTFEMVVLKKRCESYFHTFNTYCIQQVDRKT